MRIKEFLKDEEAEPDPPTKQDNNTSVFYVNPHSDEDLAIVSSDFPSHNRDQPVEYRPELILDTT